MNHGSSARSASRARHGESHAALAGINQVAFDAIRATQARVTPPRKTRPPVMSAGGQHPPAAHASERPVSCRRGSARERTRRRAAARPCARPPAAHPLEGDRLRLVARAARPAVAADRRRQTCCLRRGASRHRRDVRRDPRIIPMRSHGTSIYPRAGDLNHATPLARRAVRAGRGEIVRCPRWFGVPARCFPDKGPSLGRRHRW